MPDVRLAFQDRQLRPEDALRGESLLKLAGVILASGGVAVSLCLGATYDELHTARHGWVTSNAWLFAARNAIDLASLPCKGEDTLSCVGLMRGAPGEVRRPVSFQCTTKGCEFVMCPEGANK